MTSSSQAGTAQATRGQREGQDFFKRVGLKQPTKPEQHSSPTFYHCASLTRPAGPQTQIGEKKVQSTLGKAPYIPCICVCV